MVVLYIGLFGFLTFVVGAGAFGLWLRRHPSKVNAENSSRIVQFLFFAGLGTPFLVSLFYPGLTHLDELVGLSPLPSKPFFLITGIILAIPGLYFLGISNKSLRSLGSGANAFRLTKQVVEMDIYKHTRNPMSLGYYLFSIGVGFISGSTLLTLVVLLGVIPAHVFFLKFFEELELELRFGESYKQYKQKMPFLIPKFSAERPRKETDMNNSNFGRLSGWLALLTGVAGVLALVTLILFFVGFLQNIHSLLPMGSLNDKINAAVGILSAGLVSALVQVLHQPPRRLSLILLIGVWAGALAVTYGSWLIVTGRSGVERSSYFYFFGNGLIGIWVWSLNRIAGQQAVLPRSLTRAGSLAGIFMMAGLLALYGILLGSDGNDFSPLVMVSGLSYVGFGLLFPIWCLRLGGLILSKTKDGDDQQGFR